jgi:hypothetical protein
VDLLGGLCVLYHIDSSQGIFRLVKEEISTIKEKHRRDIFVIGGDFNLPDINWEEQTIINPRFCPNYDIWVCRFYDCFEEFSLFPQALEVDVEYSDLFLMGWFGFCRFW